MFNETETNVVSVIIPAFNAAATLNRAIQSALIQKFVLEILIIDDCSTDKTVAVAGKMVNLYPNKVKIFRHVRNKGVSATRNTGIINAIGEFIAFLDADDVWLEGKIQKQLNEIVGKSEVKLVTCGAYQVNVRGEILKRSHENRKPVEGREAWRTLLCYNFIPTPTVLARRKDILESGCFSELLPVAEDLDLWIRLAMKGIVAVVPDVLVYYYDYEGSLMKTGGLNAEPLIMNMIESHINSGKTRLDDDEIYRIRGIRYFNFGIDRYFTGQPYQSIQFFNLSTCNNFNILKSNLFILRAFLKILIINWNKKFLS